MKFAIGFALLAGSALACPVTGRGVEPTFNHDIAPLLYENCAGCHPLGQVAPFPLLTYQDAARRAALIAMPPSWGEPGRVSNPRRAVAAFDRNRNGELDQPEIEALMQFLQGSVQ